MAAFAAAGFARYGKVFALESGDAPVREVMRFGLNIASAAAPAASMAATATATATASATATATATAITSGSRTSAVREANAAGSELYLTAEAIGVPETMVDQIVQIFSGRLDFHRDLEAGFDCTVLYQMAFEEGMIGRPGKILAVRLVMPATSVVAYLFSETGPDKFAANGEAANSGSPAKPGAKAVVLDKLAPQSAQKISLADYYDATGRSLGRHFLQSPIQFTRITSGYSVRRFHPILKLWRSHTGTDFAAPMGTPVRVTADGIVRFAGVQGGYGNLVIVDHANGLSSRYGHLSSFAPGLRRGSVVLQGDLLARVGMTGLATGPHLHYEMRRAEIPFDPATLETTTASGGQQLSAVRLGRFEVVRAIYDRQLAVPLRTNMVER